MTRGGARRGPLRAHHPTPHLPGQHQRAAMRGPMPPSDGPRSALGDSVTFGWGVPDDQTARAALRASGGPVLNAGVPAMKPGSGVLGCTARPEPDLVLFTQRPDHSMPDAFGGFVRAVRRVTAAAPAPVGVLLPPVSTFDVRGARQWEARRSGSRRRSRPCRSSTSPGPSATPPRSGVVLQPPGAQRVVRLPGRRGAARGAPGRPARARSGGPVRRGRPDRGAPVLRWGTRRRGFRPRDGRRRLGGGAGLAVALVALRASGRRCESAAATAWASAACPDGVRWIGSSENQEPGGRVGATVGPSPCSCSIQGAVGAGSSRGNARKRTSASPACATSVRRFSTKRGGGTRACSAGRGGSAAGPRSPVGRSAPFKSRRPRPLATKASPPGPRRGPRQARRPARHRPG